MGRKKITIERLPSCYDQKVVYSKRIKGLRNKARELTTLCDVPHLLIAFSPADPDTDNPTSQKATVSVGNRTFEEMVSAYSNLSLRERLQAKQECLESLEKKCKKDNVPIDISQLANHRGQHIIENDRLNQEKKAHLDKVGEEISQIQNALGPLSSLGELAQIDDLDVLTKMENHLLHLLQQN